jgi:hypothetical protein
MALASTTPSVPRPALSLEDPGFEESFLTIQDTAAGTCGTGGLDACTQVLTFGVPSMGVTSTIPPGGPTEYLIRRWTEPDGSVGYDEVPIGPTATDGWTNYFGPGLSTTSSGFFLSPTLIPLDDFNIADPTYGPGPGQQGSVFTPDANLVTPEPSTAILLGFGTLCLVFFRPLTRLMHRSTL